MNALFYATYVPGPMPAHPCMDSPNFKLACRLTNIGNSNCYVFKGVISAKMVKIIKFLFFAQKVSSGMRALRPKFLGG